MHMAQESNEMKNVGVLPRNDTSANRAATIFFGLYRGLHVVRWSRLKSDILRGYDAHGNQSLDNDINAN